MSGVRQTTNGIPRHVTPSAAAWKRRLLAAVLDFALLALLQVGLCQVFGVVEPAGGASLIGGDGLAPAYVAGLAMLSTGWLVAIAVAYFTLFEGLFAATPGKALAGVRVVGAEGRPATLLEALLRNVLRPVDAWPFAYLLAMLSVYRSPSLQRLGDRVADTYVVPAATMRRDECRRGRLIGASLLLALLFAALAGGGVAFDYLGRPALVVQGWALVTNTAWFDSTTPGAPPLCGPWQLGPFPSGGDPFRAYEPSLPRHIAQYTIGAPHWDGNAVTYPLRLRLVPAAATDHGGTPTEPVQVPGLAGPDPAGDIYDATITLHWTGFPSGWVVAGGETRC